jgi:spore maturation protein CgeB
MLNSMCNIAIFGSSLVSAYWNGAATYFRGIIRALHDRGYRVHFFEPDAYDRQRHRDIAAPDWCAVTVYDATEEAVFRMLQRAQAADVVIKFSGVGVFDELLERECLNLKKRSRLVCFWDVDAPATLERMRNDPADPLRSLVPQYDLIFTYGGGDRVVQDYLSYGARECVPVYNALDPATHYPVQPDPRFEADLALLANRLPDRESRIDAFFFDTASRMPQKRFLLGGNGWADKRMPPNVRNCGHIYTCDHNSFNSTPLGVLNVNRSSMAAYGFSPPTRIFEAAGAGACIISDAWAGIEMFLEPEQEILVAHNSDEVCEHLASLTIQRARRIGTAALRRITSQHTYSHRAAQIHAVLTGVSAPARATG